MPGLRIAYATALIVLAVLVSFAVFHPLASSERYTEVQRESLLRSGDEWIVQFDIVNREGKDQNYIVSALVDSKPFSRTVLIEDKSTYTHIHHISPKTISDGDVRFAVYKEGEDEPFKQTAYYMKD